MGYFIVDEFPKRDINEAVDNAKKNLEAKHKEEKRAFFVKHENSPLFFENIVPITIMNMITCLLITLVLDIRLDCSIPYWVGFIVSMLISILMYYSTDDGKCLLFMIGGGLFLFTIPISIIILAFGLGAWLYGVILGILLFIVVTSNMFC